MSYEMAKGLAWEELLKLNPKNSPNVKFLSDEYSVDVSGRRIASLSCNIPAKDYISVLILHYLIQKIKGLPQLSAEWLTFRELSGVEGYAAAFRKRSIEPLIRKYGSNPQGIFSAQNHMEINKLEEADAAMIFEAFKGVPVLVKIWKGDEEFGPEANIFFDRSITNIFCTEDIVVLAGLVAAAL